jgi:hypothetical protein
MAKFYPQLMQELQDFIKEQKIFFTATAPREERINLSPKGMDTFCCLDEQTVAYLDFTGSGNETAAHLLENERITVMFCSFSRPLILRLYGKGRSFKPRDTQWQKLSLFFSSLPGARQIIVIKIELGRHLKARRGSRRASSKQHCSV